MSNQNLSCQICGEASGRYEDGKIIVYSPHSQNHAAEIALADVLEAIRLGQGKGMILIRDWADANNCIFG